jgi:uncharacterized protein
LDDVISDNRLAKPLALTHILPMNDPVELSRLHPSHVKVSRIVATLMMTVPLIAAVSLEVAQIAPMGSFIGPFIVLALYFIWRMPPRRYKRWGYHMATDRIRIVRGYWFYSDTVVPLGRIQHIDVDQGPIQRRYDLATLRMHTAGTHGATVSLPGLLHSDALAMREAIREHIRKAQ